MPALTLLTKPLQIAFNRYLAYDPEAPKHLARMDNKVVEICFQPLSLSLFIIICDGALDISDSCSTPADTKIIGSPIGLARLGLTSSNGSVMSGEVVIEGDLALGQAFQSFLGNIDVDLEEPLSELTGDVIANALGNTARDFFKWCGSVSTSSGLDLSEYVREERQLLPSSFEVNRFKRDVDDLRLATDRLEARIQQLTLKQQQRADKPKEGTK